MEHVVGTCPLSFVLFLAMLLLNLPQTRPKSHLYAVAGFQIPLTRLASPDVWNPTEKYGEILINGCKSHWIQFCPPSEKLRWGRCKAKASEEQSVALLDSFWSFLELEILVMSNLHPRFTKRTHPFCLIRVSFLQESGINLLGSLARGWNSCWYEGEGRLQVNYSKCSWHKTPKR